MPRTTVKAAADVVSKWVRRAGSAGEEYRQGVASTSADWAALATAAAPSYQAGVTEAIARNGYQKGIAAAGTQKWKNNAQVLGPARFAQGVQAAEGAYTTAIGPVLAAISAVDLPMRGPTGAEGNFARSMAIGKALRALKTGRR